MKAIYLGTPNFAVKPLENLINSSHEVVAVVTQPDRAVGRHSKLQAPPTKELALKYNIPVFQFEKINKEGVEILKQFNADVVVTCAYGQILRKGILELTPNGVINIHGSLLPKYRGASPVHCALINGETQTGITILKSDVGIDNGDTLLFKTCNINQEDTTESLLHKLSQIGAEAIVEALDLIEQNKAIFTPQDESQATYFKMFEKNDGKMDFNKTSEQLYNFIRGINPWPGAFFEYNGVNIKVFSVTNVAKEKLAQICQDYQEYSNGTILVANAKQGLIIKCEKGAVEILMMQAPNSKQMLAKNYLNGKPMQVGTILNKD